MDIRYVWHLYDYTTMVHCVGISIGGSITTAVSAVVLVVTLILLCCKRKHSKTLKKDGETGQLPTTSTVSTRTHDYYYYNDSCCAYSQVNYVEAAFTDNRPMAPLPSTNTSFPYVTVQVTSRKDDLSYKFIVDKLASVIPHKWEEFGIALAITPPKLQEIRDNNPDNDRSTFCDIVQEWQSSRTTRPFTRETLDLVLNTLDC